MRINRLKKPLAEYTDEELLEEHKKLTEVLHCLVGTLYPPMVREDIVEIRTEIWNRRHGRD